MKTYLLYAGKLSQKQITRLGGIIALVCGRTPYEHIIDDLASSGFLEGDELNHNGKMELIRLTAMAGLRPENFCSKEYMEALNDDCS
tara:strand:+ start:1643 stop:1903 length:261 start_codon:yes stop_codon:yes gene_type:complete